MGNPAFLQVESSRSRRAQAADLLAKLAKKVGNPRLATLASQVKLDAFTKVKQAIDDMVTQLLKEKEDEIKHKDFCTDEFNSNQLQTEKKVREKTDVTAEIVEMQTQMRRAGEDREKQNKACALLNCLVLGW